MQKSRFISLLLCFAMLLGLGFPRAWAETDPDQTQPSAETEGTAADPIPTYGDASVTAGCKTMDAQVPLRTDTLLETGNSALLFERNSGTMVYGQNMDLSVYPGSFTKIMTALLAVERADPADRIVVSQEALDLVPEDSSTSDLKAGEEVTLEQLLYCLLLDSANDAAVVIAQHVSGSVDAFVDAMNQRATELGCTGTHFTNVHGVHDEAQYTTARDLVKIMACALNYEPFKKVISSEQYFMAETNLSEERRMDTDNYMRSQIIMEIYYDYRVTGGKVASNRSGERSLIVTAESNGLSYIGIVMNTKPIYESDGYTIQDFREFGEMKKILDLGFDNYEVKQILYEGQITSKFSVTGGENSVAVGPTKSVTAVLPKDASFNDLTFHFERTGGTLNAPVEKGQTLDICQVWYGSVCIAQSELIAMNSSQVSAKAVTSGTDDASIDTAGLRTALLVFGVIVGVIVGFAAILYIIRVIRRVRFQSKRRRRRNSRRRSR